ncbi:MAG: phage tail tape measure protein [Pseudobdellovibrionaceae bacterium]|nr:phage tail tape measure protein [Pseudobdellovibrionaceae bacterium]
MTDKKRVVVEIAASFQQSFDSIFSTAGERIAKLKGRITELAATSRDIAGIQGLQVETKNLESRIGELTARIPGLKAAHESAKAAVEGHTQKVVQLSEAERQQQALVAKTSLAMAEAKAAISAAEAAQMKRSVELKNAQTQERALDGEISKTSRSLEELSRAASQNSTELAENAASAAGSAIKVASLKAELEQLSFAKAAAAVRAKDLGSAFEGAAVSIADQQATLARLGSEHVQLGQGYQKSKQALTAQVAILKTANKELGSHADRLADAEDELSQTTTAFNTQTASIKKYEEALKAAGHDIKNLTKLEGELAAAMAKTKRTHDLAARGKRQAERGRELRGDIVGGAFEVAGMGVALAAPIKLAAQFEHAMAKVGAQTMATASEIKMLEAEARKLGDTTIFSSSEAASAQSFLAQAGFSVQEIADSLGGVLNLAAAGDTGLTLLRGVFSRILEPLTL